MKYRKRTPELRHCVHCGTAFESAHKRRIYCGNSCSTLAYYARKKQEPVGLAAPVATPVAPAAPVAEVPAVTLAFNAPNLALFTAGPLLAEGVKHVAKGVGKLLAPAPPAGPSTWLPAELRERKQPLLLVQHPDWKEPRLFVVLPYAGHTFYYRAAQELLLWHAPDGTYHPLTRQAEFEQLTSPRRLQQMVQQYVPALAEVPPADFPPLMPLATASGTPLLHFVPNASSVER